MNAASLAETLPLWGRWQRAALAERGNLQNHTRQALNAARRLRRQMSLPEGLLWQHLRQRPSGLKFRNQHPIGNCVVDFFCASRRVVIEIDGIVHDMADQPVRDERRDAWLKSQGYTVVRIPACDVFKNPVAVTESLVALCAATPPPSALRAATSPMGGDTAGAVC